MRSPQKGLVELVMASHAGMSTAELEKIVTDWLATARHPRFNLERAIHHEVHEGTRRKTMRN
jgi:hypothetical protein